MESSTVALETTEWGEGPGRALLLHGVASNAAGWWALAPDLAEAGYRVVAPDLRGHGNSPGGDDYRLESYAADVAALPGPWDLVLGHSLGGAVSLLAVVGRPGFARRLILEDPALLIADQAQSLAWLLAPFDAGVTAATMAAEHPRWHEQDVAAKIEALAQCGPEVVRRTVVDNPIWDVRARLLDLTIPTLLMGADPATGAAVVRPSDGAAAAANEHVVYEIVPGAGHSIHRDDYPAFRDVVAAFIA